MSLHGAVGETPGAAGSSRPIAPAPAASEFPQADWSPDALTLTWECGGKSIIPVPFLEALRRGMGESNERLSLAQYQAAEGGMSAISNWMPLDLQCQPARPQLRRARLGWRTQQQREPLPRPATLDQFACGEPLFRIPCGLGLKFA
jgi:hypothetical protein